MTVLLNPLLGDPRCFAMLMRLPITNEFASVGYFMTNFMGKTKLVVLRKLLVPATVSYLPLLNFIVKFFSMKLLKNTTSISILLLDIQETFAVKLY